MEAVVLVFTLLVMLAGLAGTLLPVVPGLPLMWLAMLGYGWFTGWQAYGLTALVVTGLVVLLSLVVDYAASAIGAKKFGASRAGLFGAVAGGILGLIFFSLPGLILGIFLGALVLELVISRRDLGAALTAGVGALLGFLAGSFFKFMLGLMLLGFFAVKVWVFLP
jgi:uncharacterized protein YqgC (DUF456 family)